MYNFNDEMARKQNIIDAKRRTAIEKQGKICDPQTVIPQLKGQAWKDWVDEHINDGGVALRMCEGANWQYVGKTISQAIEMEIC